MFSVIQRESDYYVAPTTLSLNSEGIWSEKRDPVTPDLPRFFSPNPR